MRNREMKTVHPDYEHDESVEPDLPGSRADPRSRSVIGHTERQGIRPLAEPEPEDGSAAAKPR